MKSALIRVFAKFAGQKIYVKKAPQRFTDERNASQQKLNYITNACTKIIRQLTTSASCSQHFLLSLDFADLA